MASLELLLAFLLVVGFLLIVVTAYKVILARLAGDYLTCPSCGHAVLHLGKVQKCDHCRARVVVTEEGSHQRWPGSHHGLLP